MYESAHTLSYSVFLTLFAPSSQGFPARSNHLRKHSGSRGFESPISVDDVPVHQVEASG